MESGTSTVRAARWNFVFYIVLSSCLALGLMLLLLISLRPCAKRAAKNQCIPALAAPTFPVDAVILWADTNLRWEQARQQVAHQYQHHRLYAPSANNFEPSRYTVTADDDEHRPQEHEAFWAAVSVAKNMPWIRQIVLVVNDDQCPPWICKLRARVQPMPVGLLKLSTFIPQKLLPTFSSDLIEAHLHRADALAEHFVLMSDDMFITSPVHATSLFTADGKAIVRGEHPMLATHAGNAVQILFFVFRSINNAYARSVINMVRQLWHMRESSASFLPVVDFHHPRACTKSILRLAARDLGKDVTSPYAITLRAPLRAKRGCPSILAARTYALMKGAAVIPPVRESPKVSTHASYGVFKWNHDRAMRILSKKDHPPSMLCVNSVYEKGQSIRRVKHEYLRSLASFFDDSARKVRH